MARKFWGAVDRLGQRVRFGDDQWRTIVGIAGDVHHDGLNIPAVPEMYIPYSQVPNVEARPTVVLRTTLEAWSLTGPLRRVIASVDPEVPADQVRTMRDLISNSAGQPRFRTGGIATFALMALFVASLGLYGVMSYLVRQRRREFGIRMALGATHVALMQLIFREAGKMVGIGVALGLIGAAPVSRGVAALLYGVTPLDSVTLAGVTIVLALVAASAVYFPARSAAKSDPMESLRHD